MTQALSNQKPQWVSQDQWRKASENLTPSLPNHAPFSQESEEAVLGALLLDPNIFPVIASRLVAEDFFLKRHSYVYRAMERSYQEFKTFDYISISEFLSNENVLVEIGGQAFLTYLVNNTPSSIHAEIYAELVSRAAVRRRILMATDNMRKLALAENSKIDDVISDCEKELAKATIDYAAGLEKSWYEVVSDEIDRVTGDAPKPQGLGFPIPNFKFKLINGELTLLLGLTGAGKTAFMLWLIMYYLKQGKSIVFISMEMSKQKILYRLASQMVGISATALQTGSYQDEPREKPVQHSLVSALGELSKYQDQFVISTNAYTPSEIKRVVASAAYTQDIAGVFIDHLYISQPDTKIHGYEVWQQNGMAFQRQAKEFNCPYLVLHQLKEPPQGRDTKSPMLIDMYGGISVANVPDNIYALHRDDHPSLGVLEPVHGRVDVYELKDRNGGNNTRRITGQVRYKGNEQYEAWNESTNTQA